MLNRIFKLLVGSAAGVIVIAGLIAAGGFAVTVLKEFQFNMAKSKCTSDEVVEGGYVTAQMHANGYTKASGGGAYGARATEYCMEEHGYQIR